MLGYFSRRALGTTRFLPAQIEASLLLAWFSFLRAVVEKMLFVSYQLSNNEGYIRFRKLVEEDSDVISYYRLLGTITIASLTRYAAYVPVHYEVWS